MMASVEQGTASSALVVLLSLLSAACGTAGGVAHPVESAKVLADNRTLTIAIPAEPKSLVDRSLQVGPTGSTPGAPGAFFHAALTEYDEKGILQPALAQGLPELGTESWKVFADGKMETTWRLRPDLTWHDASPVLAEDVVLSVQARVKYLTGGTAGGGATLKKFVDDVSAVDPLTVVVKWNSPYPDAGQSFWQLLPAHILASPVDQIATPDAFANLPYWTTAFVGLGPYQLERWEPGAFIEGTSFAGYLRGRPPIERIRLVWIADPNTAMANLLSGAVDLTVDGSISFAQAVVLKQQGWPGSVLLTPNGDPFLVIQYKLEYQNPRALSDVRVRQALAHGIDKQAIVDLVLNGEPGFADTIVLPTAPYFPALEKVLTRYPLDLGRSHQLLDEAGFTEDAAGFATRGGARLGVEILADHDREPLILADSWKRIGVDVNLRIRSAQGSLDNESQSTFPALFLTSGTGDNRDKFRSDAIATAASNWVGGNRGGYSDPEYDRAYGILRTSLDQNVQNQASVDALKLLSDQAAAVPLYYSYDVVAHSPDVTGPIAPAVAQGVARKVEAWHWQ
ncbi:MAG TPA: ABC transporter substrate-binding protein [Chloroflexota bacterium]